MAPLSIESVENCNSLLSFKHKIKLKMEIGFSDWELRSGLVEQWRGCFDKTTNSLCLFSAYTWKYKPLSFSISLFFSRFFGSHGSVLANTETGECQAGFPGEGSGQNQYLHWVSSSPQILLHFSDTETGEGQAGFPGKGSAQNQYLYWVSSSPQIFLHFYCKISLFPWYSFTCVCAYTCNIIYNGLDGL